jgi:hypothetical protein
MSDSIAAVSWIDGSGEHIRVYVVDCGQIVEYMFDGSWARGPFTQKGTSVAAIAAREASGRVHHHVFIGDGERVVEHRWENDEWKPGPLDAQHYTAVTAATAFIEDGERLIIRVYARHDEGVSELCWDSTSEWSRGAFNITARVPDGLAAVSWVEGTDRILRVYSSNGAQVDEHQWHDGWATSGVAWDGRNLAATSWRRDANEPEIAVYLGDRTEITERWWNGSEWFDGTFPRVRGVRVAATSWVDGGLHIRTFVREADGAVVEYQWNDGTGWSHVGPIEPPPQRWFVDGSRLRVNTSSDPFIIHGVCYSRTRPGEDTPVDSIHPDPGVWSSDLDAMREMGVNAIKIYGVDMDRVRKADHKYFLEYAWNHGERPIYVLLSRGIDPALLGRGRVDELKQLRDDYLTLVETYASCPAVMGFSIGAEVNTDTSLRDTDPFWSDFLGIAQHIRAAAGRRILTTGLIDHPGSIRRAVAADSSTRLIDVWGIDIYKATAHWDDTLAREYEEIRAAAGTPLLIAEFGYPASERNHEDAQRDHLIEAWQKIASRAEVICGGCIFSWADEWWKARNPAIQNLGAEDGADHPLFLRSDGSTVWRDEEYFGITEINPADHGRTLLPRSAYGAFKSLWRGSSE